MRVNKSLVILIVVPVPGLILAAGASRRLGHAKQLVSYRGETLLARTIRMLREATMTPVVVVLGAESERIAAALDSDGSVRVHNDRWEQGISSSISAGLEAVDAITPQCAGVLIATCDQPRLSSEHLLALLNRFNEQAGAVIVASEYAGIKGVPAVFPRAAFEQLRSLSGDQGARKIIADPPCRVSAVEFAGGDVDIDRPDDLDHLREPE